MSKTTVLIVEDEAIVAADLAGKLGQLGYQVVGIASEGQQAVDRTSHLRPHLVLMDIRLEGAMDGIEAAELIRQHHDVPVIYLSAHSDVGTLARARLTGPFGFILKPFDERDLAIQIELALYKHRAERQIRDQREWLRVTLASIGDAVIATDAEGRVSFVNPVAESLTGWKSAEALGQPLSSIFRVVNERTGEPLDEPVTQVLREGRMVPLANHAALITRDGRAVPIEDSAAPILDAGGRVIGAVLVFHDVTERRRQEEERLNLSRTLRALSRASQAVIHAENETDLLNDVCRIVVEDCGQSMVWIGVAEEDEAKTVRPVAQAGVDEGYLESVGITWADTERGRGPTGTAIRTGNPEICHDMRADHRMHPWRGEALKRGYASSLALPLKAEGRILGALTIYSKQPDAFSVEAVRLLAELADNLAYGLSVIRTRLARSRAEAALRQSEARFRLLSTTAVRLLAADDPLGVVKELGREVMDHLDCHAFFNFVVTEGAEQLHLNACAGIPDEEARKIEWLDYGAAVCGCVARDGVRIVANDICSLADPRTALVKSYGIRAYACHPLMARGKVIGTLSFGTKTRSSFSEYDLDLMKTVTDQVAIAMERMRLIEELQKARDQLEMRVADRTRQLAVAIQSLEAEIEQREDAEKVLSEKNEHLESILSTVHFHVAFLDRGLNYVRVNEAYASADERSPEVFVGQNHFDLFPDAEDEAIFRKVLETGVPYFAMEKPFERPGHPERGTSYWDWSLQPVRGDSGGTAGLVLTRVDVTERRRAQEALRESEQLLRTVLETLPVGVWITDRAGTITMANPAARKTWEGARYVGVERYGEYKGWWADTGKLIEAEEWALARALTRGEVSINEIIDIQCFDGTRKTILNSAFPILDERGEISRAIVVNQDITELRKVERELRSSDERLRQNLELLQKIVDGITDPLIMLDRDGRVTMVNKAAMTYYGVHQDGDVLGRPCFEGLRGRERACPQCNYPFSSVVSEPFTFEREGLKDAKRVESVTVYPVLNVAGERDAVIVKMTDVTQAKLLDRQMLHNQKLASLGLMTSGIAHEINNPNSFIYFNIPILRQYMEALMPILDEYAALHPDLEMLHMSYGELKEDIFRLLGNMEHGSQRINRIVGALKGFVRKRDTEGLQRVDLKQVIDKVIALCQAEIKRKVKSFEVRFSHDVPIIRSDPEALEQVLLNLVINAVHACDKEDSRVDLSVGLADPPGNQIRIEITDNGIGIEEAHRGMIFDPFFTTKLSSMGTGLGLYICHHHVESLGGVIDVESSVGRGSTFRVLLPRTDEE
ncbi:MAG: PAS domain-containing protein [Syntrophobacteraceae bacterium]